jgi:hypothetical protein
MPRFQVRNRKTKIILGEVVVADPAQVLDSLAESTGTTIEEIAKCLGSTVDEAKEALDIVEVLEATWKGGSGRKKNATAPLSPRRLFG